MDKFRCDICGKKHDYFLKVNLPSLGMFLNIPEDELESRVELLKVKDMELILVDKSFVLFESRLFIKIKELDEYMNWDIWVKVLPADFTLMVEGLDKNPPIVKGEIFSTVFHYTSSIGEAVGLRFSLKYNEPPLVEILNINTELGTDYKEDISLQKVKKMMESLFH